MVMALKGSTELYILIAGSEIMQIQEMGWTKVDFFLFAGTSVTKLKCDCKQEITINS